MSCHVQIRETMFQYFCSMPVSSPTIPVIVWNIIIFLHFLYYYHLNGYVYYKYIYICSISTLYIYYLYRLSIYYMIYTSFPCSLAGPSGWRHPFILIHGLRDHDRAFPRPTAPPVSFHRCCIGRSLAGVDDFFV